MISVKEPFLSGKLSPKQLVGKTVLDGGKEYVVKEVVMCSECEVDATGDYPDCICCTTRRAAYMVLTNNTNSNIYFCSTKAGRLLVDQEEICRTYKYKELL